MKTYIVEIPVKQTNEEADSAWASDTINESDFMSLKECEDLLKSLDVDVRYFYTPVEFVSLVNNGNDSFKNSYLATFNIVEPKVEPYKYD
jgi:hypothetical protein